ncbi:hypothetical protein ACSFA8_22640 [Variovorax sp. RT4R15]|uniref:hypothetical protein n=1 Tax=Variovorax sp. RT4R15 TaxID=3443737 RepID=UPI003F4749EC
MDNRTLILKQYRQYESVLRNPQKGQPAIDPDLKKALMGKYAEGRKGKGAFKYIESRAESGARSCPYCGRSGLAGTADHYLPEEHFPWWAVFSRNLVPSCQQCQGAKGDRYAPATGVRPFHPLVDRFGDAHMLSIRPIFQGADLAAVTFEFGSVADRRFRRKERKRQKHLFDRHRAFFRETRGDVLTACRSALTDIRIALNKATMNGEPPLASLKEQLVQVMSFEQHATHGPLHIGLLRRLCADPFSVRDLVATDLPPRAKTQGGVFNFLALR